MYEQEERVPSLFSVPFILFFVGIFLFIALLKGQRDLALWALLVMAVAAGAKAWGVLSLFGLECHSWADRAPVKKISSITTGSNRRIQLLICMRD